MKKVYTDKTEVCYKDVCAKFYGKNANIITAVVFTAIIMIGASVVAKSLS